MTIKCNYIYIHVYIRLKHQARYIYIYLLTIQMNCIYQYLLTKAGRITII